MDGGAMRHTIFKTRWGYFGLVCQGQAVCRTSLPAASQTAARQSLLTGANLGPADVPFEKDLLAALQRRIVAYFEGENVDFSTDPAVCLPNLSVFGQAILAACRQIAFGRTQTYAQLAASAGRSQAARAVGNVMARNPVPLIVPCHRIIRADGGLGGFSGIGGTAMKQRMLLHERVSDRTVCLQD